MTRPFRSRLRIAVTAGSLVVAAVTLTGCGCDATAAGFAVSADGALFDGDGDSWSYRLCVGDDPCVTADARPGATAVFPVAELGTATRPVEFSLDLLAADGRVVGGGSTGAEPTPSRAAAVPGCGRQPTIAVTVTADGLRIET